MSIVFKSSSEGDSTVKESMSWRELRCSSAKLYALDRKQSS